jgi:cell division protein FtsB
MSARRPVAPHPGGRAPGAGVSGARSGSHGPAARPKGSAPPSAGPGSRRGADAAPLQEAQAGTSGSFTVRALVLSVVGLLAFVLLFPTVRAYLSQQRSNERLVQQVAQARQQNEDLTAELRRWNDPAYVAAQARERLAFVLPGETAFRVVDPQTVPDAQAAAAAAGNGPALVPDGTTSPWYATVWESIRVAGKADVSAAAKASTAPAPVPVPGPASTGPPPAPATPPPPPPPAPPPPGGAATP